MYFSPAKFIFSSPKFFFRRRKKNSSSRWHWHPFHWAAENGYLSVCLLIVENVDDKNPTDNSGWTPLHEAARNGHLSICQFIVENVDDKNPKNDSGWTPLHLAAEKGHLLVCQLIVENIDDKNPKTNSGVTPLHYAAENGHMSVCLFIAENVDENNPANSNKYLYNAMIHPLVRSGIKGVMWYQGESNVGWNRDKYQCAIKQLISDWKTEFQHYGTLADPDRMPFGFVQLSTIGQDKYPGTPVIRWHQTADYGYVPNEILPVNSCLLFLYLPIFLS